MSARKIRKKQGFEGQKLLVIPQKIATQFLRKDPLTRQVYITDIGYYPKAHQHYIDRPSGVNQHILIYCVEGHGWVTIRKKRLEIAPSNFIIIPANTAHRYGVDETDPWTIYWVHFRGEAANFVVNLITQSRNKFLPSLSWNEGRIKLFEEICQNLQDGYSADNLRYANMIFYYFLSSLLYEQKYNRVASSQASDSMETVIGFLKASLHTTLTLKEMAGLAHLSVSHFSSIFRQHTGFSPVEYFNQLKIQDACQSLTFSNKTIKQIAAELAFSDQYYFSRIFTRYMGLPPSGYRKKFRKTIPGNKQVTPARGS